MLGNALAAARAVENNTKRRISMSGTKGKSGESERRPARATSPPPPERNKTGKGVKRWYARKGQHAPLSDSSTGSAGQEKKKATVSDPPESPAPTNSSGGSGRSSGRKSASRAKPRPSITRSTGATALRNRRGKTSSNDEHTTGRSPQTARLTNDQILAEIAAALEREQEQDANTIEQLVIEMKGMSSLHDDEISQVTMATGIQTTHQPPGDITLDPKKKLYHSPQTAPISETRSDTTSCTSQNQHSQKNLDAILADYDEMVDEDAHMSGSQHHSQTFEQNVLITFQRVTGKGRVVEATLTAHCVSGMESSTDGKAVEECGDIMSDLVKRLQKDASPVLKFESHEMAALKTKQKEIIFVLRQMKNTKFSRKEFGEMTAATLAAMIQERPIIIGIEAEDVTVGESLELF